jgi:hypothetical protein
MLENFIKFENFQKFENYKIKTVQIVRRDRIAVEVLKARARVFI